jgi:hypothetical protein
MPTPINLDGPFYSSADRKRDEEAAKERQRLKDQFFMAAQVRPATAEHYQAWLESHLDHGGKIESFSRKPFKASNVYTVSQDGELPPKLCGSASVDLIVPAGVTLNAPDLGHCKIYKIEDGTAQGGGKPVVYAEIAASMVERGYAIDQLVPQDDWMRLLSDVLEDKIGRMRKASVSDIDALTKALNRLDLAGEAKRELGLDATATLPAAMQQAADEAKAGLGEMYKAFRYKLDPTSQTPAPSLLKPKVKPADPDQIEQEAAKGTAEKMTVMSPLKLKGQTNDSPPAGASAPKKWGLKSLLGRLGS